MISSVFLRSVFLCWGYDLQVIPLHLSQDYIVPSTRTPVYTCFTITSYLSDVWLNGTLITISEVFFCLKLNPEISISQITLLILSRPSVSNVRHVSTLQHFSVLRKPRCHFTDRTALYPIFLPLSLFETFPTTLSNLSDATKQIQSRLSLTV